MSKNCNRLASFIGGLSSTTGKTVVHSSEEKTTEIKGNTTTVRYELSDNHYYNDKNVCIGSNHIMNCIYPELIDVMDNSKCEIYEGASKIFLGGIANLLVYCDSKICGIIKNTNDVYMTVYIGSTTKFYDPNSRGEPNPNLENYFDQFQENNAESHFEGNFNIVKFEENKEKIEENLNIPLNIKTAIYRYIQS